jgi:hypothetical protein
MVCRQIETNGTGGGQHTVQYECPFRQRPAGRQDQRIVQFRFEWRDQSTQSLPQGFDAEGIILRQSDQIAQERPKPLQSSTLAFFGLFARLAPLGGDAAIDQVQCGVGQPHQLQAQKAGQFERPARISDRQKRGRLAGRDPAMEMFQSRQWQVLDLQAIGAQLPQELHFGQVVIQLGGLFACRRRPQPFQPRLLIIRGWFQEPPRPGPAQRFVRRGADGL